MEIKLEVAWRLASEREKERESSKSKREEFEEEESSDGGGVALPFACAVARSDDNSFFFALAARTTVLDESGEAASPTREERARTREFSFEAEEVLESSDGGDGGVAPPAPSRAPARFFALAEVEEKKSSQCVGRRCQLFLFLFLYFQCCYWKWLMLLTPAMHEKE